MDSMSNNAQKKGSHLEPRIYWEKQHLQFCGHHALNAIVQGPKISTKDLKEIANTLDLVERRLRTNETESFESENVDQSGNYSIQVMIEAMKKYRVILRPFVISDVLEMDLKTHKAFLINESRHWWTIREIRGTWWNLNSQLRAPKKIEGSSWALKKFLEQMCREGSFVFACEGEPLKESHAVFGQKAGEYGGWIAESECEEINKCGAIADATGKTMEQVIEERKEEKKRKMIFSGKSNSLRGNETNASAATIDIDTTKTRAKDNNNNNNNDDDDDDVIGDIGVDPNEDPELYAAIKASLVDEKRKAENANAFSRAQTMTKLTSSSKELMMEEPEESQGNTLSIIVRLPNGQKLEPRRFLKTALVSDIENYVQVSSACRFSSSGGANALVMVHYPKRTTLSDRSQTLEEAGLDPREMLCVI
jgi:hypothetical protein